ncbi:sodium:solute symporter family transporter [Marinobacterium arenosum]|uniref:sodium:solute symporter family transporter n=1 Tax=Marinobacterium arenosum TaxID=2862496 RepID=UPI001C97934A|nr:sodium/solute symporter [Marinobacterium arenosum]MBY4676255.1 sodium/solute symporter [Marinobacterium arenosum]
MSIDVIIVLAYLGLMILCGFISMKRASGSASQYLVAGRNLPFWVFFPCLAAVILGGGSTFGSASKAYQYGLSGAWPTLMFGLGVVAVGLFLARKLTRLRVYTLSEMLERRYAHGTRYVSAVISTLYTVMIAVVQIVALGTVLKALLGWELNTAIVVGGLITMVYTMLGGMIAITVTDVIQFVLMTIGILILIPTGINQVGGWQQLVTQVPAEFLTVTNVSGERMLSYVLLLFLGIMIGQEIWQRMFTARTEEIAQRGALAAGAFSIFWGIAMGICGLLAYVLVPGLDSSAEALPQLVLEVLPAGMSGIVLAALMSALMSTVDSTVLGAATLVTNDLLRPIFKLDDDAEMKASRYATGVISLIVIALGVWVGDVWTALDTAYAYLSGCIFVPVMAAFFWPKACWQGALSSIVVSAMVVTLSIYMTSVSSLNPIMYGMLSGLLTMILVSLLVGGPQQEELDAWQEAN